MTDEIKESTILFSDMQLIVLGILIDTLDNHELDCAIIDDTFIACMSQRDEAGTRYARHYEIDKAAKAIFVPTKESKESK